jgi:hypothetical protein
MLRQIGESRTHYPCITKGSMDGSTGTSALERERNGEADLIVFAPLSLYRMGDRPEVWWAPLPPRLSPSRSLSVPSCRAPGRSFRQLEIEGQPRRRTT